MCPRPGRTYKGYEEVLVPAVKPAAPPPGEELVRVRSAAARLRSVPPGHACPGCAAARRTPWAARLPACRNPQPAVARSTRRRLVRDLVPGALLPPQIEALPEWAQLAFAGYKTLNRIQSRIFQTAFTSNENMLVCAPTGEPGSAAAKLVLPGTAEVAFLGRWAWADWTEPAALQAPARPTSPC